MKSLNDVSARQKVLSEKLEKYRPFLGKDTITSIEKILKEVDLFIAMANEEQKKKDEQRKEYIPDLKTKSEALAKNFEIILKEMQTNLDKNLSQVCENQIKIINNCIEQLDKLIAQIEAQKSQSAGTGSSMDSQNNQAASTDANTLNQNYQIRYQLFLQGKIPQDQFAKETAEFFSKLGQKYEQAIAEADDDAEENDNEFTQCVDTMKGIKNVMFAFANMNLNALNPSPAQVQSQSQTTAKPETRERKLT